MFSDTTSHWATRCIEALAKRGIIQGYPNGTFRPNAVVSRAEFAVLMRRVFPELSAIRSELSFTDVFPEFWASDAIVWAAERGLFSGYENNRFRPNQTISRVQALVVVMSGLSALQATEAVSELEAMQAEQLRSQTLAQTFIDADEIPPYAKSAVGEAIASNIVETVFEPRALKPNQAITRGEVAALLCRTLAVPTAELVREYSGLAQDKRSLFQQFLPQEDGFDAEKLAFLDRTIAQSPYRNDIKSAAIRLQLSGQLDSAIPVGLKDERDYPARGSQPKIDESGLDFLSSEIRSACVCISSASGDQLKARWLGRRALENRQMWSSTKFIPLLNLVDRVNGLAPTTDIDQCRIRRAGASGGFPFNALATGIMSYDNRIATSNSLAAMFKHFNTPVGLEKWTQQLTGNQKLSFQGRYGEVPFIQYPELWDSKSKRVLLKSPMQDHQGQNLVSTYDLTRLITMASWHWRLSPQAVIPNLQTHSLESVLRAMGVDTARYVDVALETLGLTDWVKSSVILSKSGFGRSDLRDRTELTYCALVQFSLPRTDATDFSASHQHYSFGLTLIAAQRTGDANQEARFVDALMATEVTEIIRRIVKGELVKAEL